MTGERATIFSDLRVCRPAHKPRALRRDNIFAAYMLGALAVIRRAFAMFPVAAASFF